MPLDQAARQRLPCVFLENEFEKAIHWEEGIMVSLSTLPKEYLKIKERLSKF
jgi:hypothetical protein